MLLAKSEVGKNIKTSSAITAKINPETVKLIVLFLFNFSTKIPLLLQIYTHI